jgi:hypothetical protein
LKNIHTATALYENINTNGEVEVTLNPFHIIIFVLKNLLWNPYINTFFNTSYSNKEQNVLIQCFDFYSRIIETIQNYDENYLNNFVTFHFYGLFYDMLINDKLKNEWSWDNDLPFYISTVGDYTEEEFKSILIQYVSLEEINHILKNITNYKKIHVNFIQYLSVLNKTLEYEDPTDENQNKDNIQFNITKNERKFYIFYF